jgi:predicted dehydrogenase
MHGVAIIGCGQVSDLHAAAYSGRDARIVALSDPDRQAAEAKRDRWGIPEATVYADYREALERSDVDIAEILVPHDLHYEIAAAALAAGKHVSLQKPMAVTLDQADALVQSAGTASGLLRVFENFLFYPPVQRAKAIIDSGELGDIHTIVIRTIAGYSDTAWPPPKEPWRFDPGRCGGSPMIFDDGHHYFAMALYLAGPIARVHTSVRHAGGYWVDIPAMVSWEHGNGILGTWIVSYSPGLYIHTQQYSANDSIEITGSNGVLWVTRGHGHLTDLPAVIVAKGRTMDYHDDLAAEWTVSFQRASQHFLDAIDASGPAVLSAADAREVLRVAVAAGRSIETGGPVDVTPGGWPGFTTATSQPDQR